MLVYNFYEKLKKLNKEYPNKYVGLHLSDRNMFSVDEPLSSQFTIYDGVVYIYLANDDYGFKCAYPKEIMNALDKEATDECWDRGELGSSEFGDCQVMIANGEEVDGLDDEYIFDYFDIVPCLDECTQPDEDGVVYKIEEFPNKSFLSAKECVNYIRKYVRRVSDFTEEFDLYLDTEYNVSICDREFKPSIVLKNMPFIYEEEKEKYVNDIADDFILELKTMNDRETIDIWGYNVYCDTDCKRYYFLDADTRKYINRFDTAEECADWLVVYDDETVKEKFEYTLDLDLDEATEKGIEILGKLYRPSEILYNLDNDIYEKEFAKWKEDYKKLLVLDLEDMKLKDEMQLPGHKIKILCDYIEGV